MGQRGFEIAKGWEDKGIKLPRRETAGAAGYDIAAAEDTAIPVFHPGQKPTLIATGLKAYCQPDECFLVLNRSSGPSRGIIVANGVGLIDSDYYNNPDNDGHFMVLVYNSLNHDLLVKKGDRIAQVVFQKFLTVDDDNATGVRRSGIGSTDHFRVIYDCDDVLWPLTEKACQKQNIPYGKQKAYRLDEDNGLSEAEKAKLLDAFHDVQTFREMEFYPEISELSEISALGAEIGVNSNCFNREIADLKRAQLIAKLPFVYKKDLHINVVTPRTNRKAVEAGTLAFVDDSPYNISTSQALLNLVPRRSWNIGEDARKIMLEGGGEFVEDWRQALPAITSVNVGKHIIYVKDLAEANEIIKRAIKLAKGEK